MIWLQKTYLFLFALTMLILGYFSLGVPYPLTGAAVYTSYHDYVSITAQSSFGLSMGEGSTKLFLPAPARSCTYKGSWITNNDQKLRQRNFCHNAQGTFSGSANARQQSVVNDPDLFRWSGLSNIIFNPPAQRHEGYSLWMETCDPEYYVPNHKTRYGVQGTLSGFGTKTLSFDWNYLDRNARPDVLFKIDLTCELSR